MLRHLALLCLACAATWSLADPLEDAFLRPPPEARPWVYWFWLNGNITSNGITADLEAMKRTGIGGVLIMEVDQGAPVGPVDFMGSRWREMFRHVVSEARRLGLEVNMNNDAGWNGSGGPWIKPEQSMQEVVWSETNLAGPLHFEGQLPQPGTVAGFYRDIVVQAFPAVGAYRIPGFEGKAAFQRRGRQQADQKELQPGKVILRGQVTNLTSRMDATGRLVWDAPEGEWTVVRFGHTSTGVENAPAPATGRGLECDKLSREGIEANFAGMMAQLVADNGTRPGANQAGLVATHIDSWENGSQNWTARMREEFRKRRGYDLGPFLAVMTGRVVESLDVSERFLWDLRKTVSELVIENYAGRMRELAHANGLRFTVEAYGSPCDAIPYAGESDEPMGEFWSPNGGIETCRGMASAGHVYGKRIVGAEAFTAGDTERWREHPGAIKALGDLAFCEGINRFVFHRYALQPWAEDRSPGMTMGPWGQHYERTQTWWEHTPAWHQYLARCQLLLRQGLFVADICYLQAENPAQGFSNHPRHGYDWDECGAEVVLGRMSVQQGRIVLPDGMSYSLLVLPSTTRMTPPLLRKIRDLVQAGATVIGAPPHGSPSLADYPDCDRQVKRLAAELWGDCDGNRVKERRFGEGRVIWTTEPEAVLRSSDVPPDFVSGQPLRHIHRVAGGTDIYFVANISPRNASTTATFRIKGRIPELWWPETGRIEHAPLWEEKDGRTSVFLPLGPSGSVFVVFRQTNRGLDSLVTVSRDGKVLLSAMPDPPAKVLIRSASYGPAGDPQRTRDVREKVQHRVDTGERSFPALMMAEGDDPAPGVVKTLTVNYTIEGKDYIAKAQDPAFIYLTADAVRVTIEKARYGVLDDPKRTRDVRDRLQRLIDAGESSFQVARMAQGDDPAFLVVKTLEIEYTREGRRLSASGTDPEVIDLKPPVEDTFERVAEVRGDSAGRLSIAAFKPGRYEVATTSGSKRMINIPTVPPAIAVHGPWKVRFAPNRGAPGEIELDNLASWSVHPDPGVKFFSGAATYIKTLNVPRQARGGGRRLYLDLGRVQVMAEVKLNGKNLSVLWKPPFRLDVTDVVKAGENKLEVAVVNLWPNRMIGDELLPEDSERNPDGTLKRWPQWLLEGKPSPSGRHAFTSWRLWKKNDTLLESGLLGPVQLQIAETAQIRN